MPEDLGRSLSRKNLIRGALFFTLCTFGGLCLSFLWSGVEDIGQVLRTMRVETLLLACLCMFADWTCGSLRFHIFVSKMAPKVRFVDSLRANLATLCVSGVTPFQTGGVGHLYIFTRAGVPLSGAVTTGIICFLGTLTILMLGTGYVLLSNPPFLPKSITLVSRYSLLGFTLVFTGFLLLLIKPRIILVALKWLGASLGHRFKRIGALFERITIKLEQLITEHQAFTRMFISHHKVSCLLSLLLTIGFFACRFLGGYVVVKALGGSATLWEMSVTGMIINFVTLFAPSPGASGIAELTSVLVMKNLMSSEPELVGLWTLLTRFFTVYCAVGIGGIVLGSQLTKDLKEDKTSE